MNQGLQLNSLRAKLGIQFLVSNGTTVAYFVLSLILSRMLTPAEIGIFSISSVLIALTHVFRDFGVTSYLRRQKELTDEVVRAAAGVLICASWLLAVLLYWSSSYWARYFGQPGIRDVMQVQAIGFLIIPFGSIPQAALVRELEVKKTSLVALASVLAYVSSCIVLAHFGFSYMSMAWANLFNIVVTSIGYSALAPKGLPWMPSWRGWRRVAHFGGGAMVTSMLVEIDLALPDLLLGRISGPHAVGIFSRGNSTVNMFNTISTPSVNYFALPVLAKAYHGGAAIAHEVLRAISYLSGLIWPALAVLSLTAKDVILLLYGQRWLESAAVVPWLCLCAALQIGYLIVQPAVTAVNKPYLGALPLSVTVAFKIGLGLWSYDGSLTSFARAMALAECASLPVYLVVMQKRLGLTARLWFAAVGKSIAVSGLLLLEAAAILPLQNRLDQVGLRILLTGAWAVPGWCAAIYLCKHPLKEELARGFRYLRLLPPVIPKNERD